jgi:hypothetical protein
LDADNFPELAEPLGGLLASFGALLEEDVRAIYVGGGLTGYQSLLQSPFCYVPHDIIVPGALTTGDLCDVAAGLAPRPLRLAGLVDGLNRSVSTAMLEKIYLPTQAAYLRAGAKGRLEIGVQRTQEEAASFLLAGLGRTRSGR